MQIGDFRFSTSLRGLAACLATLGVPLKSSVPIANQYTPERPVPQVPFGHQRWYPGRIHWFFEAVSQSWSSAGKPVTPKLLTKAYHRRDEANRLEERFKDLDDALQAGDLNRASVAWLVIKNEMPYAMAGMIGAAMDNYQKIWMPLLKEAYEEEKRTGLTINMVSVPNQDGHIYTTPNPTDEVKDAML